MKMSVENKKYSILVVDDEPEIRELLSDYLADDAGYTVHTASTGEEALDSVLPSHAVDLVLSDINMPGMKGFELLNEVRERYPNTRRVLITAYDVEDYIEMALLHDVGNIFVKTTPFNFSELSGMIKSLLLQDIFGARRFFDGRSTVHERLFTISQGRRIDQDAKKIVSLLPSWAQHRKLNLVLMELLTNAVFYGARNEKPDHKEKWQYNFELTDEETISVSVVWDTDKYAISIVDKGGRLRKREVLYWLHRQTARGNDNMPLGVYDSHGRGFYIARQYIDRLIINIDPLVKTEVVVINYLNDIYQGSKPLYINEL
ncbi:MAG: response regulator [Chitinivibrionales bacterium]